MASVVWDTVPHTVKSITVGVLRGAEGEDCEERVASEGVAESLPLEPPFVPVGVALEERLGEELDVETPLCELLTEEQGVDVGLAEVVRGAEREPTWVPEIVEVGEPLPLFRGTVGVGLVDAEREDAALGERCDEGVLEGEGLEVRLGPRLELEGMEVRDSEGVGEEDGPPLPVAVSESVTDGEVLAVEDTLTVVDVCAVGRMELEPLSADFPVKVD